MLKINHLPRRRLDKINLLPVARKEVCFCAVQEIVNIRAFRPHGTTTPEVNRATG